ncbi:DoxX family protein [Pleurocapsa sp. PCC 7319]|uniref:DoxX family protein n=1 Tax=Pleurocapsa sp. PCC 7319 TaxID=118161 RepID=UPI00034C1F5F|nr:DoxX family protein [Pleurocapsa sp. PCC 7319]
MLNILESILELWRSLYLPFPVGIQGITLLALRVGLGILFILHGYPKLTHLQQWSKALKLPIYLCFLSALSMFLGGFCLVSGFLTPLACLAILCSMLFALVLEITQGLPFVASDPYLIPQGEYEGASGKGEPPSQEKAFIYSLILVVLLVFGPGAFSINAWLINI